jgi:hypothetical protein
LSLILVQNRTIARATKKTKVIPQPLLVDSVLTDVSIGWELAGKIITDMSFLRDEGHIKPVERGRNFQRHYRIEYELVIIVDGRNLRYEARWPAGGTVRGRGQTSIAAAFKPGTK